LRRGFKGEDDHPLRGDERTITGTEFAQDSAQLAFFGVGEETASGYGRRSELR
jgi:hypothetical protein